MIKVFDKLEDRIRHYLARKPRAYAFLAGVAIVLFWRGVWDFADAIGLHWFWSIAISSVAMLLTGTFVSFFIGAKLLISGLKEEKRVDEKTADEIQDEEAEIAKLRASVSEIRHNVSEIKKLLESI